MIQAVDRAIRVLTVLQGARRMSLGELATRSSWPRRRPTVWFAPCVAARHGPVQESDSSRYQLGPAMLRLGNVYLDTLELRSRVAIPWAEASPGGPAARSAPVSCSSTTS